ncbi:MAG: TolC family protein [Nitrospirota bacterium]
MKKIIFIFMAIFLFEAVSYAQSDEAKEPKEIREGRHVAFTLEELYRIAFERAEKIMISEEDLYIAETGKDKAVSVLLPKLSAFGNYTRYTKDKTSSSGSGIQPESSASWGLRLDQSFSLSGRELTAFKISKENIQKSRYGLYEVKEAYLLDVSSSYYDVLRARKALEIAEANVERLTKHRDAAKIRLKVGEVTKTALLRAEAELSGAQSELVQAQNGLKLTKAVLARIVGLEGDYDLVETKDSIQYSKEGEGEATVESLKQKAMSERSELKSLELQKKISEKEVAYARGAYWPTLSVEGVYSRREDEPDSFSDNRESIYGGLNLNFPFFEGGLRIAEVNEAKAKQRQAELAYKDKRKDIGIEVENAYLDLKTQEGVMEKFRDQVAYARDNYNAVSKQFEYGLANSLDVMDANTLLVTAERQLSDAKYNYQLSVLKLQKATGTLLKTAGIMSE